MKINGFHVGLVWIIVGIVLVWYFFLRKK